MESCDTLIATHLLEDNVLSPQQKRLWSLLKDADLRSCVACCAVSLEGEVNDNLLAQALTVCISQYDVLNTTFRRLPGMLVPFQVNNKGLPPTIQRQDWSNDDHARQEQRLDGLLKDIGSQLDVVNGPLVCAYIIKQAVGRYILAIGVPALCSDGSSLRVLVREIVQAYVTCLDNALPSGEVLQYSVISAWLNELLSSEEAQEGIGFWRSKQFWKHCSTSLPITKNLNDEPWQAAAVLRQVDLAAIDALATKYKLAVSTFLLSCWQILLGRHTGQEHVLVGLACDGRVDEDLRDAVGPLTRHVPLVSDLSPAIRFRDLWNKVEEDVRESHEWQECFTWSNGTSCSDASISYFPFCYDYSLTTPCEYIGGIKVSLHDLDVGNERFDVRANCLQEDTSLILTIAYDVNRYTEGDITLLADQFVTLLHSVTRHPEQHIELLDCTPAEEKQFLLRDINDTKRDVQTHHISRCFEEQVRQTCDRVAIAWDGNQVSYAALNERANQLARYLRTRGVTVGDCVGVCLRPTADLLVGILGILKAGGAYVPLDPAHPPQRLLGILRDVHASIVITESELLAAFQSFGQNAIRLDHDWQAISRHEAANLATASLLEAPIYVIFTSGSEGSPKGVRVSHRGFSNLINWYRSELSIEPTDVSLVISSVGFDLTQKNLFVTLLSGGRVQLISSQEFNPEAIAWGALFGQATILNCASSMFYALINGLRDDQQCWLHSLRHVVLGGEPVDVSRFSDCYSRKDVVAEITNGYGPTECSDIASCYRISDPLAYVNRTIPIGKPISNVQMYILDRQFQPVPIGPKAEVYIGGDGVSQCYIGDPRLTAARFLPDPFSTEAGRRLYKTGDMARYLRDGNIEFVGREDQQVKILGTRIELGEIEAMLVTHDAVRASACKAWESESGVPRLVAYIVPKENKTPSPTELRIYLQGRLPPSMVPSTFITLKDLPMTLHGKLDRNSLPAPDALGEMDRAFVPPGNAVEEALVTIWQQVLGVERVGVNDDFFELGGHSLLATQLVSRVSELFNSKVSLITVFEARTVANLARHMMQQITASDVLEKTARLFNQLQEISDEEAQEMLTNLRMAVSS